MQKDYLSRNNKKVSFRNEDLNHARFYESDLRGVDFSGADLSGTCFINVKTGITPTNTFLFFLAALLLSALSGYIATLAGTTVQTMLASQNLQIRIIGMTTIVIIIIFIVYTYWKGGTNAITVLMVPIFFFSIIVGGISYFSGAGTGQGGASNAFVLPVLTAAVDRAESGSGARRRCGKSNHHSGYDEPRSPSSHLRASLPTEEPPTGADRVRPQAQYTTPDVPHDRRPTSRRGGVRWSASRLSQVRLVPQCGRYVDQWAA